MLLGNGFTRYGSLNKQFGGTSISGSNMATVEGYWHRASTRRNMFAGSAAMAGVASVPNGARHPMVWLMPIKAGGLASGGSIVGSGGASGSMQSGYNIDGDLTGSGDVTNAPLGLIVSIAAALIGSGNVSSATAAALASMVASITGSSSVTATAAGLARLGAALVGSGAINANNTQLMSIAASIRGYGDLTPEGIRDSVWAAIIESGFSSSDLLKLIAAATQGNATGLESGAPVFKSLDGTKNRVTGTYSTGTRVVTSRDVT
jgi:hypothetical protein